MDKESKIETTDAVREKEKQEQAFEDILYTLDIAIEMNSRVELTISNPPNGVEGTATVLPYEITKGHLCLTTNKGIGMAIELSRIKKAEIRK